MKIDELLRLWEEAPNGKLSHEAYSIRLPLADAAKLQALAEIYPRRAIDEIISELLSAALHDVEQSLPYIKGDNIVAIDEEGDPLYEDIGPTPRYLSLTKKILNDYQHSPVTQSPASFASSQS
ncbi:type 1 pili tip component [Deltaproteobacteria bacterium]|nr:type 1 pili tip component [Deltaproteobacteria bacterium]